MSILTTQSQHLANIYRLLLQAYGEPKNEPDFDPLGGLIGTILSQHTSDVNSDRAYKQLIAQFPTWEEVRDAPTDKIADAIKSGGLANTKSVRIQDVLYTLTEQHQAQGGAPEDQSILAIGLGVDRGIPSPAIRLAPTPEVQDNGRLPAGQGRGEELRDKGEGLFGGARIKLGGARRRDGVVAREL